ncbi:hypothetical protein NDU88_005664 [Pleurodeles waltl]|uniref:Uncharacterized protein n=1 Tax=Pleurodeles waltl TaxID=8319 RepID=A0AAV7PGC6_PLEWA|nr:hypothetical protein NDU88_005664 [Pleurodeles waltl]
MRRKDGRTCITIKRRQHNREGGEDSVKGSELPGMPTLTSADDQDALDIQDGTGNSVSARVLTPHDLMDRREERKLKLELKLVKLKLEKEKADAERGLE